MGATSAIYAGLGFLAFAGMFVLALARAAASADDSSEQLLTECLREQTRAFEALASATIEARRMHSGEVAARLSRRRTWQQPSSA